MSQPGTTEEGQKAACSTSAKKFDGIRFRVIFPKGRSGKSFSESLLVASKMGALSSCALMGSITCA